jgi:hypothetical protein
VGSGRQQRGRGTLEMRDNGFGMGDIIADNQCDILLNITVKLDLSSHIRASKNWLLNKGDL